MFYSVNSLLLNLANFDILRYFRIPTFGQIGCFILKYVIMLSAETGNVRKKAYTHVCRLRGRLRRESWSPGMNRELDREAAQETWKDSDGRWSRCKYFVSCQTAQYCSGFLSLQQRAWLLCSAPVSVCLSALTVSLAHRMPDCSKVAL